VEIGVLPVKEIHSLLKIPIYGGHKPDGQFVTEPYLCKIDKNGNILWVNYYPTATSGYVWYALQISNETIYFTGNTNSFGKRVNGSDVFLFKTDQHGNLK